jgi:hypothetical protein
MITSLNGVFLHEYLVRIAVAGGVAWLLLLGSFVIMVFVGMTKCSVSDTSMVSLSL